MQTEFIIDTIGATRTNFLKLVETCSIEQLNKIPEGYSNNLVWNLAHILSSQQMLCYELSSLEPRADKELIEAYRPGTFPEKFVDEKRLELIKETLLATVDKLKDDYRSGIFKSYKEKRTRYGVLITNIEEAISYVSSHEALHFGYAKALHRAL